MTAIFKREISAYFHSALGFVFCAALYFFTGYYFLTYNIYNATADFSSLFTLLFPVVLFMVPILTMRLMSEDKQSKTDQVLLTSPVSPFSIVLGKYLSALCVFLLAILMTLVLAVVTEVFARVDWPLFIGHFLGLTLLGAALIAMCMFLSSLTESQVIAALLGFTASLFLFIMDALTAMVSKGFLYNLFYYLSFSKRYQPFTYGILDLSNVLFFVSIAAFFLFLTTLTLEKRRWS